MQKAMNVDLTTGKLKTLAKRLARDLSRTPEQCRRTPDALARGFGYDGFPALRAAIDRTQQTQVQTRAQSAPQESPPDDAETLPTDRLVAALRARGVLVVAYTNNDLRGLVGAER